MRAIANTSIKIALGISLITYCSCSHDQTKEDNSTLVNETRKTITEKNNETPIEKKVSENQADLIKTVVSVSGQVIKQIKKNDSIKAAHRDKLFAYQVGFPIKDIDEVFETFGLIDNSESFYVLKKSRKEYYIIYLTDKSLKEMNDSIDSFKSKLPAEISTIVKTINLTSLCSKREKLMRGEDLTKRKQDQELPCLICN